MKRLLAVSSRRRLSDKYGSDAAARIVGALREAGDRLAGDGIGLAVAYLDGADDRLVDMSASGVREALGPALLAEAPDGILIVGGDDVVPFFRVPNPVRDRRVDPDPFVLSDAPYGDTPHLELPVGRIPDGTADEEENLVAALGGLGRRPDRGRHGLLGIVNSEWADSGGAVMDGRGATLRTAPAWTAKNSEWKVAKPACLYFNVHGFRDRAVWRAMHDDTGLWHDVLGPADITSETGGGALVFSEACYGASVVGKTAQTSIALAFLGHQCRAFVGATGLAFGSYTVSLRPQFADAVACRFLDEVTAGREFGAALLRAREVARSAPATSTFLEKTAQQFVLFGNPLATL